MAEAHKETNRGDAHREMSRETNRESGRESREGNRNEIPVRTRSNEVSRSGSEGLSTSLNKMGQAAEQIWQNFWHPQWLRGRASPWNLWAKSLEEFDHMFQKIQSDLPRSWQQPLNVGPSLWNQLPQTAFDIRLPKVNVIDRDSEIVVQAEIPGVEKKDIEVSTTDSSVTIQAKTNHKEEQEQGDYYYCEISEGKFLRTVGLPVEVDADKAKATFKDGLLEIALPKVEQAKRRSVRVDA